ncbi:MAG: cyclase family protein, partial [Acidocella sp.]|nr:cyclase family protein [Acidocella sp.]
MDFLPATNPLWALYDNVLSKARFTDLTHAFHPGQPHFPLFPDEAVETLFSVAEHGFEVTRYAHVGQWGTHVDAPSHFVAGGRTVDAIPVEQMLLPLVVLNISARAAQDPDTTPTLEDVQGWEARHGRIPNGSFVALRTDWCKKWPDATAFANKDADGTAHYPGWSREVLEFLFTQRDVRAIGHEQTDTDRGLSTSKGDYGLEYYVLSQDRWQIELVANLDKVPEAGALLLASWPKPLKGCGYPARLVAIHE